MSYQTTVRELAREVAPPGVPVFMSSLLQAPLAQASIAPGQMIAIFTANDESWMKDPSNKSMDVQENMKERKEFYLGACGITVTDASKFRVKGCQDDVKGFQDLTKVKVRKAEGHILKCVKDFIKLQEAGGGSVGAIIFECTELPPFSKIVREETGLPVYDIVTACNAMYATLRSGLTAEEAKAEWRAEKRQARNAERGGRQHHGRQ